MAKAAVPLYRRRTRTQDAEVSCLEPWGQVLDRVDPGALCGQVLDTRHGSIEPVWFWAW